MTIDVFPVSGRAQYSSLFHDGHQGVDIFAPHGADVLAVCDGALTDAINAKGGTALFLTAKDGERYYYAHLSSTVGVVPRNVRTGELIGYVGDSGNAKGKDPHLHFEVRRRDGKKVDPAPELRDAEMDFPLPATKNAPADVVKMGSAALMLLVMYLVAKGFK